MTVAHSLLIVDDCAEDREVYREYLAEDPHNTYKFCEASLAEVGLELFLQQPFDVVLLDFYMPDMTGLEFLGQLQEHQREVPCPIIMLTGQGNEELAVQAMKHGVQDYLGKQHLQPEVLQRTVRSVIQQSHLHVALRKTREQQRLIATTALRIRQSLDLDQILDTAVAEVQQLLECDHVAIYQCADQPSDAQPSDAQPSDAQPSDAQLSDAQLSDAQPSNAQRTFQLIAELGIPCGQPISRAENLFALDICDIGAGRLSGNMASNEYQELSIPIVIHTPSSLQSQTWGYLVAHQCSEDTDWQPEVRGLFNELAVQLAIAIQQAELLTQTQAALEKAQELSHFKSQILATISHEYRSPLSVILGAASTLDRHGQSLEPSKQARFLTMIQQKARHMTRLVDNMLVMHQCELDQARFEPAPMNILQFVADIVEEHRDAAPDHELVLQITGKTSGFWGDQGVLRLVMDNLLSNAIKFSPEGGRIEVHLLGETKTITLAIKDFGIGIPSQDQGYLFQSFRRASNANHMPGIGLGLSIVKACITLHEGILDIESQEGHGTTVSFQLPKHPQASQHIYQGDS